jgi:hypothetical protein
MPTDDEESKRRVSRLAMGLGGLAVLVVAAGVLYPRWAKQRERDRAREELATGLDKATLEFERCVAATDDPSAYGRSMFEQLRTRDYESDYKPAIEACNTTYTRQLGVLRNRFGQYMSHRSAELSPYRAKFGSMCNALELNRGQRDGLLAGLDVHRESLPAIDCTVATVEARPLESNHDVAGSWDIQEPRSGEFLIIGGENDARRYARIERDGALTWFVPPTRHELYPVGSLQVTAKQPFLLGYKPESPTELLLGTWLGSSDDPDHFEQRRLNVGRPDFVVTSTERWFFVEARLDSLALHISDDEGKTFTPVHVPLPREFEDRVSISHWGYAEGKRLVLLAVREPATSESGEAEPSLVFVVRVDEAGTVTTSSVDYDYNHRSIDLYACATPAGAFAVIGHHLLIHTDDATTLVHDFTPASTGALACQGERAFVVVAKDGVLQRYVCNDQDCGDAVLLTHEQKLAVSLRATPTGVRAALLTTETDVDLYIVDEPLGGPLERLDQLVRSDKLKSGWLEYTDMPILVEGLLHPRATRADEFRLRSPTKPR